MIEKGNKTMEALVFQYIDEFKFLFFPDKWSNAFLDYSKNEILALLYIYRYKTANMTEVAEYLEAPLNTATGVIARLEKKKMVERIRGLEDRRVVNLALTEKAEEFIEDQKQLIEKYVGEIYTSLSEEEKTAAISIFRKAVSLLKRDADKKQETEAPRKIRKITIE